MARIVGNSESFVAKKAQKYFFGTFVFIIISVSLFFALTLINIIFRQNHLITYPVLIATLILFPIFYVVLKKYRNKSNNYAKGMRGELTILDVLTQLSNEFIVFPDVTIPQNIGNIDFVVIGPSGLFAIEVKNRDGEIDFKGHRLTKNGKPFEKDDLKQIMDEAISLHDYLLNKGIDVFVQPVLVFANRYAKVKFGQEKVANVTVIGLGWLNKVITEAQTDLSNDLDHIASILTELKNS